MALAGIAEYEIINTLDTYINVSEITQLQLEKKNQNNPLVSAETIRHSSTYIILYIKNGEFCIVILKLDIFNINPR